MSTTAPCGPTYVDLAAALQESRLAARPPLPDPSRFGAPESPRPARELIARAASVLSGAAAPVMLVGRGKRTLESWRARVALADKLGARVMTDLKTGASFPTKHPLHVGPPGTYLSEPAAAAVREADVILALDWIDLAGTLKQVYGDRPIGARIVAASCDVHVHRGFSMDYFGLPPVDVNLLAEPDVVVPLLLEACKARTLTAAPASGSEPSRRVYDVLSLRAVAAALNEATEGVEVCLTRLPLGWPGEARHFSHPLDYLGGDGGAGVGAGPGISVGAGLALKGTGRITIGMLGDGDYLMSVTALWTALHYKLPALILSCN